METETRATNEGGRLEEEDENRTQSCERSIHGIGVLVEFIRIISEREQRSFSMQ